MAPATLDSLPPEVKDERLASLACLTRTWQHIVEARTFSSIRLRSLDLHQFKDTVASTARRRAALNVLLFEVALPDQSNIQDEALTRAIYDLFAILEHWSSTEKLWLCVIARPLHPPEPSLENFTTA